MCMIDGVSFFFFLFFFINISVLISLRASRLIPQILKLKTINRAHYFWSKNNLLTRTRLHFKQLVLKIMEILINLFIALNNIIIGLKT
jgi:hypothetical protein